VSTIVLLGAYKLYDKRRVESSGIYQAFIYAYAYGGSSGKQRQTLLIYPATHGAGQFDRLRVRTAGEFTCASVTVLGLHIPSVLDEMKQSGCGPSLEPLLRVVEKAFAGDEMGS
jgi:hypothetical protein